MYTCTYGAFLVGLDYVSHDDILPYTSTSQDPFQHELFDQFLALEAKDEGTCITVHVIFVCFNSLYVYLRVCMCVCTLMHVYDHL